jgi:hypothetical protein
MAEHSSKADDSMWRWWPCFLGGSCAPLLADVLVRWLSPHLAVGIAFFIMWVAVGLVFTALPPNPKTSFVRWIGGGGLGAVVAGVLAFFVHWK